MDPTTKSFVAVAVLLFPESVMLLPTDRFCATANAQSSFPCARTADVETMESESASAVRVARFIMQGVCNADQNWRA